VTETALGTNGSSAANADSTNQTQLNIIVQNHENNPNLSTVAQYGWFLAAAGGVVGIARGLIAVAAACSARIPAQDQTVSGNLTVLGQFNGK